MRGILINAEIRNYKEKIYLGLTLKQFSALIITAAVTLGVWLLLKNYLDLTFIIIICTFLCSPIIGWGFVKINGMNFEKFVVIMIKNELKMSKVLYFKTDKARQNEVLAIQLEKEEAEDKANG